MSLPFFIFASNDFIQVHQAIILCHYITGHTYSDPLYLQMDQI